MQRFSHPIRRINPVAVPAPKARRFHRGPAGSSSTQTERGRSVPVVSMGEVLEAGVPFGHQTRRWNPKMRRFIFTERGGIYIIDLQQTLELLEEAHGFARNLGERGGTMLFVGTKKQSQDAVSEHAAPGNMPYVNHPWPRGAPPDLGAASGPSGHPPERAQ